MTELAFLARELGVSERTLRRAANDGGLRVHRPSPRVLRLPLAESAYIRRRWPLLAAMRSALRTERNVRFALLFGSAATGEDSDGSDVDVIVGLRDPSLDRVLDLERKLAAAVGRPVDVVRLEDAEAQPAFLSGALDTGRVLVDREKAWQRLRRRATALRRTGRKRDAERKRTALAGIDRFLATGR